MMMRLLQNWILTGLMAILLVACGGDPQGDLDDDSQTALEVGIISTLNSPYALHPAELSKALRKKHENIEGLQLRNSVYGSIMPPPKPTKLGGAIIKGSPGGRVLETQISGSITASVTVRDGEVGLLNGEIYVGEGTKLTNADGNTFTFVRGKWSAKAQKALAAGTDTIVVLTINIPREYIELLNISDTELSAVHAAATDIFQALNKLTPKEKREALQDIIEKMAVLEVIVDGGNVIKLADIAKFEYSIATKSVDSDKDVLNLGFVGDDANDE